MTDSHFSELQPANEPLDPRALVDAIVDGVVARLAGLTPRVQATQAVDAELQAQPHATDWLTAAEAAQYLGFRTTKAFYSAVARRQVPASRLGKRLRFHRTGLDALLRQRAARMPAACPVAGKDS